MQVLETLPDDFAELVREVDRLTDTELFAQWIGHRAAAPPGSGGR